MSASTDEPAKARRNRRVVGLVVALALLGLLAVLADAKEAREVLDEADWRLAPAALAFAAASYAALSASFALVNRLFGIRAGAGNLLGVGFVSVTLSHVASVAGITGHSMRMLLLREHGAGAALAASVFYSFLKNLGLFLLLPVGVAHVALRADLPPGAEMGLAAAAGLLAAVFLAGVSLVASARARRALVSLVNALGRRIPALRRREQFFQEFETALEAGAGNARARPGALAALFALSLADWASVLACLSLSFAALGGSPGFGTLVTGFAVGVAAGIVSMIPGGLGVQEGSMAAVYALLGVPLERALLAAVLFRLIYYVVPFAASLALYRGLLAKARAATT